MIQKSPSPLLNHVRVLFKLPSCVWADRIYLVGEFNHWDTKSTPLQQGRDGSWQAILDLPKDQIYEFHYLIDGHWQTDYHADGFAENAATSPNSLVCTVLPNVAPEPAPSRVEANTFTHWLPSLRPTLVLSGLAAPSN